MTKTKVFGVLAAALYVGTIFAANAALQHWGVVPVGFGYTAPAGVYFAGLAFTLRDFTQDALGRRAVLVCIGLGGLASVFVSPRYAAASASAFLLSELADFGVYTPLRERRWLLAVLASNVVGFIFDSVLFLWLAFHSFTFLPGQLIGKAWVTAIPVALLWLGRRAVPDRQLAAVAR